MGGSAPGAAGGRRPGDWEQDADRSLGADAVERNGADDLATIEVARQACGLKPSREISEAEADALIAASKRQRPAASAPARSAASAPADPREAAFLRGLMATAGAPAGREPVALATRPGWRAPAPQRRVSWLTRVACFYAQCCGFAIFPTGRDKKPLVRGGFLAATRDCEQLEAWFQRWPDAVIAAATGALSGIFVLDLDAKHGKNGLEALRAAGITLPRTWTARTPSGGCHLYFAHPAGGGLKCGASVKLFGRELPGCDTRGSGGYVCLPTPRTGYRWTVRRPGRSILAAMPTRLIEGLRWREPERPAPIFRAIGRPADRLLDDACAAITAAQPGCRQETLAREAWRIGRLVSEGRADRETALAALLSAAGGICGADWDRKAALATARRRFEAGARGNG